MGDRTWEQGPNCTQFDSKSGTGGSWLVGCQPLVRGAGRRAAGHRVLLLQLAWARHGLPE